jgi:hypothetical protein
MSEMSLDAQGPKRVRLDERATDLWDNMSQQRGPAKEAARRVYDIVRNAEFVVNNLDQVIKDRWGAFPRGATLAEIEHTQLIQGEALYR